MEGKTHSHWPITLTNGAAAVFNLMTPLLIVRLLSPENVGRYKIFFLYVMLSPGLFFVTGLNNGLYHWTGKYPETKPEVRQCWTLMVGITLAMCAIGMLLSPWIASSIQISLWDLRVLLLCVPFIIASAFLEDLFIARGDVWAGSFYGAGFNVLRAVSITAVAWWTRSMEAVIGVFAAGMILRTFVGWRVLAKTGEIGFSFSWEKSHAVLKYALPVSIAAFASLAISNVDQMILSVRLRPAEFALYAIGCLSIPLLHILEISVNRVLIPGLSRAFSSKRADQAAALFAESVSELYRFLWPATLGLILFAQPIVDLVFTKRYSGAADYLQYFAVSYLFLALPFDAVARARADGGWILRTYLFFSVLSIGLTWWAAGQWNAIGALFAVLISQCVMRLYSLVYASEKFEAPLSKFLPLKDLAIQSGMGLAAGACALLMRPLFSDSLVWFLVTGSLFVLVYFGGLYLIALKQLVNAPGPMHVLELAQTVCLGGLERMIYTLSQELQQHPRFKVLVATYDQEPDQPSLASQFSQAGIPLIQWQKGRGFSIPSVFRLVHLILSRRVRILHVHNLGPLMYGTFAKLLSLGHVHLVMTLHSLTDFEKNRRNHFYLKVFSRFADRIIAVSPSIQVSLLAMGVHPKRVEVIPNGVLFSEMTQNKTEPNKQALRRQLMPNLAAPLYKAHWVLCLARLHPGKGQEEVLKVWSALPKETRSKLALFFVGQETFAGHRAALEQQIQGISHADRVFIPGPSDQPHEWIQSSDMFISGSLQEGMPLAPLEAAGSGLLTLLSDIEGHRFLQPWAYFFDPKRPEQGAQRILELLPTLENDDGEQLFENRWKATASLRSKWSAPAMTASYAEAFESR